MNFLDETQSSLLAPQGGVGSQGASEEPPSE